MSLVLERRWWWRTPPTLAARHIVQVSWTVPLEFVGEELDIDNPDFKRVRVSVPEWNLLEFHCGLDPRSDTLVEVFRFDDLPDRLRPVAIRYVDEVDRRAIEKRYPRPPFGFR